MRKKQFCYDITEIAKKLFDNKPRRTMFVYNIESKNLPVRLTVAKNFEDKADSLTVSYFRDYLDGCGFCD